MRLITIFFTALALTTWTQNTQAISALSKQNQKPVKSFTQWCEQKLSLPKETRHTVEVLLKEAATQNCEDANQKLSKSNVLDLGKSQISDIKPLSGLTNLTKLNLTSNKISDIKSLSSLTNLNELKLWENPIKNKTCPVKPESVCIF